MREKVVLLLKLLDVSILARDQLFFLILLSRSAMFAFCFKQSSGMKVAKTPTAMLVLMLAVFSSFQVIVAGKIKNASQPHIIFILADDLVSIPHTLAVLVND